MWKSLSVILTCTLALALGQIRPPVPTEETGSRCEPVTIAMCTDVGYFNATFPNFRLQGQAAAESELQDFWPLIRGQCSNAIVQLLCAVYAPFCAPGFSGSPVGPCKNLCMRVRDGCEERLKEIGGFDWPPHLDCDNYPTRENNPLCFGPEDPSKSRRPRRIPRRGEERYQSA